MLKQKSGKIVQNSSVLGLVAMKYRGAYNASKFAIEGYTDTLRLELADTPIHISLIEPGLLKANFARPQNVILNATSILSTLATNTHINKLWNG